MTDEKQRMPASADRPKFGKPTVKDAIAGLVTGLFSIPEGMAYASIGGFAAPLGLWSGVVPTIIGSVLARTVLMVTTLTSAIALSTQSVLASAGLKPDDIGAIATMTVMVGIVMLILGLLKLGSVMSYVSTAVMTGFTTGIALQIVAGVLKDVTGYTPSASNTVGKFVDVFIHVGQWQWEPLLVALATVAVWLIFFMIKQLKQYATLISLVVVSVVTALLGVKVELVSDIAEIVRSLPPFTLPDVSAIPALATGAVAIALVALAQAAGISAAVANPDGSPSNASKDFTAQGIANVAGGFFGALPTGGSLSRTGVATSAGAMTRWAGIFAGVWLALIVLLFGPFAGYIPMAVIGGLMLVIGGELIVNRRRDIVLVLRTSWASALAMIATFVATTGLPLQQAIFIGAGLSIVLTAVTLSRTAKLFELTLDDGDWEISDAPKVLPSGRTTVLHYSGAGFFSEVSLLDQDWPDSSGTRDAAIVLSVRGTLAVPSATFIKSLERRVAKLRDQGVAFVIAGIPAHQLELLRRTGALDRIGPDNVIAETPRVFDAVTAGYRRAEELRTRTEDGAESS